MHISESKSGLSGEWRMCTPCPLPPGPLFAAIPGAQRLAGLGQCSANDKISEGTWALNIMLLFKCTHLTMT